MKSLDFFQRKRSRHSKAILRLYSCLKLMELSAISTRMMTIITLIKPDRFNLRWLEAFKKVSQLILLCCYHETVAPSFLLLPSNIKNNFLMTSGQFEYLWIRSLLDGLPFFRGHPVLQMLLVNVTDFCHKIDKRYNYKQFDAWRICTIYLFQVCSFLILFCW